jgi:hypothetical protein
MIESVIIADSKTYIHNDPFQSQLHRAIHLSSTPTLDYIFLEPPRREKLLHILDPLKKRRWSSKVRFIITSRQRVTFRHLEFLRKLTDGHEVIVYEQDPWEAYVRDSSSLGFFEQLTSKLNVKRIVVTTGLWKEILQTEMSCEVVFARMGIEPQLVRMEMKHTFDRSKNVEFRGTVKSHRVEAFNRMMQYGLDLKISPNNLGHQEYLDYLSDLKIFVHDESGYYDCVGLKSYNQVDRGAGLWAKDLECAAQGTFVIRNSHQGAESYGINRIPLVKMYTDPKEVVQIVRDILSMSWKDVLESQLVSRNEILQRDDWSRTVGELMR